MLARMPAELVDRLDAALREFVIDATSTIDAIGDELRLLTEVATGFVLDGGKRLRPQFCYWGARAVGGTDDEALVRAAASLELLHACALVHDDVIDRSATRRGRPSVHERFAAIHREQSWNGEAAAFGAATAILLGDLFLSWSDAMLAASGIGPEALARASRITDATRTELMAGQYLDIVEQARGGGSVERALHVARFKAAKYTVERPLHLGVALAGGPDAAMTAFSDYGLPLGEAFQLRDDMLGVFGDPAVTGKPAGDDLREGKRTVLVATAMQAASPADRDLLSRELGNPDLDAAGVEQIRAIVMSSGAADQVETVIADRVATAVEALESAELAPPARDALVGLATAATRRND
jgi:geranylgeranyl diphosphate synthase type I